MRKLYYDMENQRFVTTEQLEGIWVKMSTEDRRFVGCFTILDWFIAITDKNGTIIPIDTYADVVNAYVSMDTMTLSDADLLFEYGFKIHIVLEMLAEVLKARYD